MAINDACIHGTWAPNCLSCSRAAALTSASREDMLNSTIARLIRERDELKARIDAGMAAHAEDRAARDWLARERDKAVDERDEARAEVGALAEQLAKVRAELGAAIRERAEFAEWIACRTPDGVDHACAECLPAGPVVIDGFQCVRHRAKAIVAEAYLTAPAQIDAALADHVALLERERDEALAEVGRLCKLFDSSGEHNVPELLDHYWQWSGSAERARVVAWLRGQGAWEKDIANAIEAGEHDR